MSFTIAVNFLICARNRGRRHQNAGGLPGPPAMKIAEKYGIVTEFTMNGYPLVMANIAIENGQWLSTWQWSGLLGKTETGNHTLWWTYKKLLNMAIEIVDFPIKNGDFPLLC